MSFTCPYVCDSKTVGGYCRTTFCINPTHSNVAEWLERPYQKKEKEEPLPPPLGLKPRYVHDSERLKDIISAMERYSKVSKPIPGVWIDELKDLISYS